MHYDGEAVKQDYEIALKYFKLAADQGHDDAQNNVGLAYANGEGKKRCFKSA